MKNVSTRIIKKNNKFFCFVDKLSIFSEGETLEQAYSLLELKIQETQKNIKDYNLEDVFKNKACEVKDLGLKQFVIKSITSFVIASVFVIMSGLLFGYSVKKGALLVSDRVEVKLKNNLPETEKEKIQSFRESLGKFKPYISELKKAFKD